MSLPSAAELSDALSPSSGIPTVVRAADRGRTTFSDRAVIKLVAAAVAELDGAPQDQGRRVAVAKTTNRSTPRVEVDVRGRVLRLAIDLTVLYPAPIRQVAAQTRQFVVDRVGELSGLDVKQVDITVVAIPLPGQRR